MSSPKEPNYFCSLVTHFSHNDEEYISYCFGHCENEHVVGEASSNYLACPYAIARAAMPASIYNRLLEEKEGKIKELSALIRRDLNHWLIPRPEDHPHE